MNHKVNKSKLLKCIHRTFDDEIKKEISEYFKDLANNLFDSENITCYEYAENKEKYDKINPWILCDVFKNYQIYYHPMSFIIILKNNKLYNCVFNENEFHCTSKLMVATNFIFCNEIGCDNILNFYINSSALEKFENEIVVD